MGADPQYYPAPRRNTVNPYSPIQLMRHPMATAEWENRPRKLGTGEMLRIAMASSLVSAWSMSVDQVADACFFSLAGHCWARWCPSAHQVSDSALTRRTCRA